MYTVIRDTREKTGWTFDKSKDCSGTIIQCLPTGDYSIVGQESSFVIERKATTAELATNLFDARFYREMDRLDAFTHAYLVCEFSFDDVVNFPVGSGIPQHRWKYLKMNSKLMISKINDLQLEHPNLRIVFTHHYAREFVQSLFKKMAVKNEKK